MNRIFLAVIVAGSALAWTAPAGAAPSCTFDKGTTTCVTTTVEQKHLLLVAGVGSAADSLAGQYCLQIAPSSTSYAVEVGTVVTTAFTTKTTSVYRGKSGRVATTSVTETFQFVALDTGGISCT